MWCSESFCPLRCGAPSAPKAFALCEVVLRNLSPSAKVTCESLRPPMWCSQSSPSRALSSPEECLVYYAVIIIVCYIMVYYIMLYHIILYCTMLCSCRHRRQHSQFLYHDLPTNNLSYLLLLNIVITIFIFKLIP